jgi:hypothetical protein
VGGIVGVVVGVAAMALITAGPAVWWIASLVPGFIAFRLRQVPEGYSPGLMTGFFVGIWVVWFWGPILVVIARFIGLLPSGSLT